MDRKISKVYFPRLDATLEYYVSGGSKNGFGVRVVEKGQENCSAEVKNVSKDFDMAAMLAHKLARNTVFPGNLHEIFMDFR